MHAMIARLATLGLTAVVLTGCEQENQTLPVGTDPGSPVSSTIDPATGGTVTSASDGYGISIDFPAASVSDRTEVTVSRIPGTDLGGPVGGTVLEGTTFAIEPAGLALEAPARISIRVADARSRSPNEQLALDGVAVVAGAETDLATSSIDLTFGILEAGIDRLGNVGARIAGDLLTIAEGTPGDGMTGGSLGGGGLLSAGTATIGTAGLLPTTTTWTVACEAEECLDVFHVIAEPDLVDRYEGALGAINLVGTGSLTFTGDESGTVTGTLSAKWEMRLRTAGSIAAAPQHMAIDASETLPYEIRDDRIHFGGWALPYRIDTDDGRRYLVLELPPTEVTLRTGGAERTVRVAARVRLAEVD